MADLYDVIGVKPDASPEEIKRAGRKAQKATHPDAGGDPEKFRAVTNALVVLLDPAKREQYDSTGEADTHKRPEDIEAAQAMDVLAQMMSRAMEGDARFTHLPDATRELIEQNIRAMHQGYADFERRMFANQARIDQYLRRLKKKGAADPMRAILEAQRAAVPMELAQKKAHLELALRVNSKALELLADYEYQIDQNPSAATTSGLYQILRSL